MEATQVLGRTPDVLQALLLGLSDEWTRIDEGPETWSPFDIVGHLIDGEETDWMVRVRTILSSAGDRQFKPFDRMRHRERNANAALADMLTRFEALRSNNLTALSGLEISQHDLQRTGMHPDFGQVTLEQLLATWVTHDLVHIAQIARVMAKRHKTEVGPWQAFLPLLNR